MTNPDSADKRGYLSEPFRLFHLRDCSTKNIPYHYHEFHKLILFLSGELTYRVEGRGYEPKPGDLLLIPTHAIHQPEIGDKPYERCILWIQPEGLRQLNLDACFDRCRSQNTYLLMRDSYDRVRLQSQLFELEQALKDDQFGSQALAQSLFMQLMVAVNRRVLEQEPETRERAVRSDPKMDEILLYINQNLTADLSAESLCKRFFLSRSWLMHRFKAITGCPIHQYVLQKRLILAAQLLRSGANVSAAAAASGFRDYSAFLRAFRKAYSVSPRDFR